MKKKVGNPNPWEAKSSRSLKAGVQDQPGEPSETSTVKKIIKQIQPTAMEIRKPCILPGSY